MTKVYSHTWLRQTGPDIRDAEFKAGVETQGHRQVGDIWKSSRGWIAVMAARNTEATVSEPYRTRAGALEWLRLAYEEHLEKLAADPDNRTLFAIRTRNGMRADRLVKMLEECASAGSGFYLESNDDYGRTTAYSIDLFWMAHTYRCYDTKGIRDGHYLLEDRDLADRLTEMFPRDVVRCEDAILPIEPIPELGPKP